MGLSVVFMSDFVKCIATNKTRRFGHSGKWKKLIFLHFVTRECTRQKLTYNQNVKDCLFGESHHFEIVHCRPTDRPSNWFMSRVRLLGWPLLARVRQVQSVFTSKLISIKINLLSFKSTEVSGTHPQHLNLPWQILHKQLRLYLAPGRRAWVQLGPGCS